jgi:hypothetical protein
MTSITGTSTISNALSGLQKADQMLMGAAAAINGGLDNMAEAAVQLQTAKVQASASAEILRTSLELEGQFIDLLA